MSPTTGPYDGRWDMPDPRTCRWCGKETSEASLSINGRDFPIIEHLRPWEGQACPGPQISSNLPEVDYLPPVNPDKARPAAGRMVEIPEWLLIAIRIDVTSDRDRARGELGLLAPAGSGTAARADAHEKHWRAMHPGYSEFLDWPFGGGP